MPYQKVQGDVHRTIIYAETGSVICVIGESDAWGSRRSERSTSHSVAIQGTFRQKWGVNSSAKHGYIIKFLIVSWISHVSFIQIIT